MRRLSVTTAVVVITATLLGGVVAFVYALVSSTAGEVAAAIGSILGGIVGAGGAVGAVYFLIAQERKEEATRVTTSIRSEIIEFSKIVTAALRTCEHIPATLHATAPFLHPTRACARRRDGREPRQNNGCAA